MRWVEWRWNGGIWNLATSYTQEREREKDELQNLPRSAIRAQPSEISWTPFHILQHTSLRMARTSNTDDIVILLCDFYNIKTINPTSEIWISFKRRKSVNIVFLNNVASNLVRQLETSFLCIHWVRQHAFKYKDKYTASSENISFHPSWQSLWQLGTTIFNIVRLVGSCEPL